MDVKMSRIIVTACLLIAIIGLVTRTGSAQQQGRSLDRSLSWLTNAEGVLITEKDKDVSMSFRSKGNFYVNKLANKHFEGGGHIYAAGGRSLLSLSDTETKFEQVLEEYKNELLEE